MPRQKHSEHESESEEELFVMSDEYVKLLDHKRILKKTKNKKDLSVTLKKTKLKGVGLYATKHIKKNEIIAYYKIKVFRTKGYESPTNFMYSFEVYKKSGDEYKTLIGDLDLNSFSDPVDDITFWAPFANEPTKSQRSNAELDQNTDGNYKNKTKVKIGQYMIYHLVARKDIKPGDEIMWYYGPDYERDYIAGKK